MTSKRDAKSLKEQMQDASNEEMKSGFEWRFSYLATRISLLLFYFLSLEYA
ncbi:hypothetical protein [Vibrio coralliirubri]|uniref:hypothetical protein n=1 Tax=Vibrio coralliirubri TaxID=1516159 RepID=UPI0012E08B81|nr:hypothetical protein [Vibrio coralliirubri]